MSRFLLPGVLLLLPAWADAQSVSIPRAAEPVEVDGVLDEPAWRSAALFTDFRQIHPAENVKPTWPTDVRMMYDDKFLYVGFHAHDEAGKVRASVAQRDAVVADDYVGMFLDTFNDRRQAYELIFNPLGVQQDGIFIEGRTVLTSGTNVGVPPDSIRTVGTTEDFSFDLVMLSKGRLTESGYTVEVAIPFRSLRYKAGKDQVWGLHLFRRIKRLDEEIDSWRPVSRNDAGTLSKVGTISGIEPPYVRQLELIPSVIVSSAGRWLATSTSDPAHFATDPPSGDPGGTARIGLTPSITADIAANPDFAQVEADQIVLTANERFPIFFPEKRPFFLEGREIFQTPLNALHTRAIVDPLLASKLSGTVGGNAFGLLVASDDAPGNFSAQELANPAFRSSVQPLLGKNAQAGALRLRRDVGKDSKVGFIATTSNFVQRHNHLSGIDASLRLDAHQRLQIQALGSLSRRPFFDAELGRNVYRTGRGLAYYANYSMSRRHLNVNVNGEGRSPDYRSDIGFSRRLNSNSWTVLGRYESEPRPNALLIGWSVQGRMLTRFDWQGRLQNHGPHFQTSLNLKKQTNLRLLGFFGRERVFEHEFGATRTAERPGAFLGEPLRSLAYKAMGFSARTTPHKRLTLNLEDVGYTWNTYDFDLGNGPRFPRVSPAALADPKARRDPGGADLFNLSTNVSYQTSDALRLSVSYKKNRMVRRDTARVVFDSNIYGLLANCQFSAATFTRLQLDYDSLTAGLRGQFLLGWTPHPGTVVYAGFNEDMTSPELDRTVGWRRNRQTLFIKLSLLLRRSL